MKGEKKLSSDKKKRSRKKRGAGRVRDRLKFDIDTSELYPLSRREEASFYDDDAPVTENSDIEISAEEGCEQEDPVSDYSGPEALNPKTLNPEGLKTEDFGTEDYDTEDSGAEDFAEEEFYTEEFDKGHFDGEDPGAENSGTEDPGTEDSDTDDYDTEYLDTGYLDTGYYDTEKPGTEEADPDFSDTERSGTFDTAAAAVPDTPAAADISKRERVSKKFRRFWTRQRADDFHTVIRTSVVGAFAVVFLMPIVLTITNSLMTKSEINANYGVIFRNRNGVRVFISNTVNLKFIPDIVSFEQYFKVLILSPEYLLKFWNSFLYVVPIVVFQLAIASLAAYGFARYRGKVREVIFFAYIILMLMPYQVTLVPNYLVSKWLNILDTRWAIWLPGFFSPFAVYMLTKYMRRIPKSIYEAAEIDGAGEWQIFSKICLPNCRGGIASIAILLFIDYWNMVEQPLILLSNDQLHPLSVFLSKINSGEISLAFAVAVIYMVLPMMVFLYGEEYLVEGIVYQGGIKE